ncbi:signal recognition particle-docking protein FtsY [Actinopolymorpha alba]|uniref:signal recognition particle-docking protein FtsY n=1 Tax=Actinopolymorpha alba TaxID=533267 RepID=UPI00037A9419|nr:signal recognition particle-docking protein FtsY [Actinopolymorpha alba]
MEYVVIALVIVILAVVILGLLAVGRRSRGVDLPPTPRTPPEGGAGGGGPGGERDDSGTITTVPRPGPPTGTVGGDELEVAETVAPPVERPAPAQGRLIRLRARLARSQSTLGKGLLSLLSRDRIDEDTWEEIESALITADVGVGPTQELVERLRTRVRVEGAATADHAREILREELLTLVGPDLDRTLDTARRETNPAVFLVVGVNGTGKTTTVGKLARVLVAEDKDVVLGAADTFRAAAADQLATWGDRVGVPTVRGPEAGDPASVAFDTVKAGVEQEADVVIIDTAGRLHTKTGLMDELGKVKRVIEKQAPVSEVLLVIDATTGQNGLTQARVFSEVVDVTGIVLTKLDSTAKGGIIVAVQRALGVPVKLVGLGEGPDDLAPFEPAAFVDALLGE